MLRQRVVVLRVAALRCITSPGPDSSGSADHNEVRVSSTHEAVAAATHHSPIETIPPRKMYGKEGYNFIEHIRTSGPGAALGRVRWKLSVYVMICAVAVVYLVSYMTTYIYVLTTNQAPFRNSLFQHFPCDLAVVENKFTLKRHVVEVIPAVPSFPVDGAAADNALGEMDSAMKSKKNAKEEEEDAVTTTAQFVRPAPAIVERKLHVNALLHRVYLYLQKSRSLVLVDAQAELNPLRFMSRAKSVGQETRTPVGFLREDQLLPDPAEGKDREETHQHRKRWWRLATLVQATRSSSSEDASAVPAGPKQIYVESEVRLRDAMNGYQKGHLYTYEQTIKHLVEKKLAQRFYRYILARGMTKHKGLRKVYAEEMIRNGLISGSGVTLTELVPDVSQFAEEIFSDLKEKLGDDVILYHYCVTLH